MDEALDRVPGGFLAFGDDSRIRTTNATLCSISGYSRDELEGHHVESLLSVPSRIFYQTHVFPLLKMQGYLREIYLSLRTKSAEEIPILLNAARVEFDGESVNECLLIPMQRRSEYEDEILRAKRRVEEALRERDELMDSLSDAKEMLELHQAELQRQNCALRTLKETLEERVEARTAELNGLVQELQGLTYAIVHDLRAPLRAISSTSAILLSELSDPPARDHARLLERQRYNAAKMASLVDDLVQLSRIIVQPIKKEPLDLSHLAEMAALEAVVKADGALFEIGIEAGIRAEGDFDLVLLALRHLMDNAVKFSPHGGAIHFGRSPNHLPQTFCVEDAGIGMDAKYLPKIFLPFQRLHLDEEYPGNGIGLAIVERVVKRHGGSVWVESLLGRGTQTFFRLP